MKFKFTILTILISINVYSQVNVMDIDTNKTQVNINNYGILIENKGTVNIGKQSKTEKLEMPKEDLGKITDSEDDGIHYVYTDDYRFAGDKVKINGKVYRNADVSKRLDGKYLFKLIGNEVYSVPQIFRVMPLYNDFYFKDGYFYLSKYKNCNDDYLRYKVADNYEGRKHLLRTIYLVNDVVVRDYDYNPWELIGFIFMWGFILLLPTMLLQDCMNLEFIAWIIYSVIVILLSYIYNNY